MRLCIFVEIEKLRIYWFCERMQMHCIINSAVLLQNWKESAM